MSYFTPADAEYIKGSVKKICVAIAASTLAGTQSEQGKQFEEEGNAECARLFAFIDGCTLEKGK